jgi:hypothetical protein
MPAHLEQSKFQVKSLIALVLAAGGMPAHQGHLKLQVKSLIVQAPGGDTYM